MESVLQDLAQEISSTLVSTTDNQVNHNNMASTEKMSETQSTVKQAPSQKPSHNLKRRRVIKANDNELQR